MNFERINPLTGEVASTATSMLREAASITTQISGEVIPSDSPGKLAMAIRIANDSEFGLSSSVFTKDAGRGLRVAKQIQSGICHVNGATVADEAQMPFGGVGASGYNRFELVRMYCTSSIV